MKRLTFIVATLALALSALGKDIKGRVIDMSGMPLEFVNVVLLQDSAFVDGVITGNFSLPCDVTDRLKLRLSFVVSTQNMWISLPMENWETFK